MPRSFPRAPDDGPAAMSSTDRGPFQSSCQAPLSCGDEHLSITGQRSRKRAELRSAWLALSSRLDRAARLCNRVVATARADSRRYCFPCKGALVVGAGPRCRRFGTTIPSDTSRWALRVSRLAVAVGQRCDVLGGSVEPMSRVCAGAARSRCISPAAENSGSSSNRATLGPSPRPAFFASRSLAALNARARRDRGPARSWFWGARDRTSAGSCAVDDLPGAATERCDPHRPA
jgi:hypothetical protein